ncbi:hypothetical protein [Anaerostipes sp.]|uniref:hypothetical protein n=1 Tax=Anaerostipes sp. TaxID=1872530 RepID=UPI0025C08BC6|nr:hypothetical protein [Anaerostipes sp.]MBS7007493.1 hypothetical protein [Anaerostipes sp.]
MNIWENTVLTDQGRALQAKLLKGETLKIKRVTTGTKKVPVVDLRQQTSVTEGGYDITLQPARTEGGTTILPVLLENKGLEESYELWQVGFYAEDPEEGDILFCLAQASQAKHVPSEAESPGFSITWEFCFNTSDTVPFEVVLNSAGLVNIEAYQVHTEAIHEISEKIDGINSALDNIATEVKTVNNSFGYGTFSNGYVLIGKTVCVSFKVLLATNIAAGRVLCSGLPKPLSELAIINVYDSSASTYSRAKVTYDGAVYVETAHNSGASLLINGAYIAK